MKEINNRNTPTSVQAKCLNKDDDQYFFVVFKKMEKKSGIPSYESLFNMEWWVIWQESEENIMLIDHNYKYNF